MLSHLMPAADASPPCSTFTRSLGVRPAGTGLRLDRIVLVSLPGPWPKPAVGHPALKAANASVAQSEVPSRLFAAEPWTAEACVELYERDGLAFTSYRWVVGDESEIAGIVAELAAAPMGSHGMAPIPVTVPTYLVCTQGSHDHCCGSFGESLAQRIDDERPGYRVRRVSHTGGHRFAPTFLALPSGRMWAYGDLDLVDRVASGAETSADFHTACRGWLGAQTGPAQVAELAARAAHGNPFLAAPELSTAQDGDATRSEVRVDGRQHIVVVRAGRQVPTIACESPGGQPSKVATEYDWNVVEDMWS